MTDIQDGFAGTIQAGKFAMQPLERVRFLKHCEWQKNGTYFLKVTKSRPMRTAKQMGYLWGTVYAMIADDTGQDPVSVHEEMKQMFLKDWVEITGQNGEKLTIETVKSLSNEGGVRTVDMMDYIKWVRDWAKDFLGVIIPEPDPNWRNNG